MSQRTIVITGGSSGIGRATVEDALAKGWNVAFTYNKNESMSLEIASMAEKNYPMQKCKAYQLDLQDFSTVEAVGEKISEAFNDIHAVVCNSAIDKSNNSALMPNEDWLTILNTNLSGHFFLIRYFLMDFISNKFGRIISLSSLAQDGSSGQAAYAASKGGLRALTKSLAKEYGNFGITANIVVPGLIETSFISQGAPKGLKEFFRTYCPSKKLGTPHEVANAILFLASKEANYINGAELHVTGGIDWVY